MARDGLAVLQQDGRRSGDPKTILLFAVAIIAALHFGQTIFVPVAVAVLLCFVLAPLVRLLRRLYLPRVPAVLVVVLIAFMIVAGVVGTVVSQINDLASNLPRYEYNLRGKIRNMDLSMPGSAVFDRAMRTLREVGAEIERKAAPEGEGAGGGNGGNGRAGAVEGRQSGGPSERGTDSGETSANAQPEQPQVVRVAPQPQSPWETVQTIAGPLFKPLAMVGLVVVFVIFMLLKREDLRDRVIRLAGAEDVLRTTAALDDAAFRVSRYLLMHLILNVIYGIPVAAGLWLIGVPNPLLWGLLATVLRFIPYAGPILAAIMPISLAIAVDPGWSMVLMTIGLLIVLELFSDNVMEPWLYGTSTGLSSIAIIAGAVFWVTLWGPVGLLLATPLTVCLVVLGRHVPQLAFLDVLLGNAPALPPEVKLYQRLLAGDVQEVEELTEEMAERMSLEELCDEVFFPVLALAEQDRRRGALTATQQAMVGEALVEVLDELIEEQDGVPAGAQPASADVEGGGLCLVVAARHGLDEAAATLLCRLLQRHGRPATVVSPVVVARRALSSLEPGRVERLLVCYVAPVSLHHPQRMLRRLRGAFAARIPAGLVLLCGEGVLEPTRLPPTLDGADVMASASRMLELDAEVAVPGAPDAGAPDAAPPADGDDLAEEAPLPPPLAVGSR